MFVGANGRLEAVVETRPSWTKVYDLDADHERPDWIEVGTICATEINDHGYGFTRTPAPDLAEERSGAGR